MEVGEDGDGAGWRVGEGGGWWLANAVTHLKWVAKDSPLT